MNPRTNLMANKVTVMILFTIVVFMSTQPIVSAYTTTEAENLIQTTEKVVIEIFQVILEAEEAGADTSDILVKLDSAANALNKAKLDLSNGVSERLIAEIETIIYLINDISREASQLKASALSERENAVRSQIIFSTVEVTLFIGLMYRMWVYTKTRYYNRTLELIPEEASSG